MKAKYILSAVLVISMASCHFLESESPSAMDSKTVYSNAKLTEQAIAGVYDVLGGDRGYRNRLACGYIGLNTDIEHFTKTGTAAAASQYQLTPSWSEISNASGKDAWGYFNIGIERCNNIIEGLEAYGSNMDEAYMNYYLGEALFLRSFLYLDMVKIWGDVPPRFTSLAKDPTGVDMPKQDRNLVYAQLRSDLKRAAELLAWSNECPGTAQNQVGRPSKGAALALLMRVDMYYAGRSIRPKTYTAGPVENVDAALRQELYSEVLWAYSQLSAGPNENNKFLSSYEKIFQNICADVKNYYQTEVIWAIPFLDGGRGQYLQYNCPKSSDALLGLKNNKSGSTNSTIQIVPTLYYDFDKSDKRRDITIAPYTWMFDAGTKFNSDKEKVRLAFPEVNVDLNEKFLYQKMQSISGWYSAKCRVEWMARERGGNDDGIDYPIIRYADVVLMAAEASIGGVTGDVPANMYGVDGQAEFNRVRSRAGLASKTLNMANLQDERKFEFAGELLRKWDLMRWGNLRSEMENAKDRIDNLNLHQGEFAGLSDTVYYKYKYVGAEYSYTSEIKGYLLDSIYGLLPGESGKPATYSAENGWVKKNVHSSDNGGRELAPANYILYDREHPEQLDSRQLYPIFSVNLGSSTLWNDYGY